MEVIMSKIGNVTMRKNVMENLINEARKEGYNYKQTHVKQHDRQIKAFERGLDSILNRAELEKINAVNKGFPVEGWESIIRWVNITRDNVYGN
jgi:hypothetical protein